MLLNITRVDKWKATIDDVPGAISEKLEGLARAGADLEYVTARRTPEQPGKGALFVSPLATPALVEAAERLGFVRSTAAQTLRIEGPDQPGVAFLMCRALAAANINLRGMAASRQGPRFLAFLSFDSDADAERAMEVLNRPL